MTLLETMIAMSLLAGLLIIIFGLFRDLSYIQDLDRKDYEQSFYDGYTELRLNQLFSNLMNENASTTKTRPFRFYTDQNGNISSSPTLVFKYNNGIRKDPFLSGDVLARLYVDNEQNQLRLAIWPLHMANPHAYMHQEILLNDVEKMDFEFLSVAEDNITKKTLANIPNRGQWTESWDQAYNEMPIIMKVRLTMTGDSPQREYLFALPTSRFAVTMKRE